MTTTGTTIGTANKNVHTMRVRPIHLYISIYIYTYIYIYIYIYRKIDRYEIISFYMAMQKNDHARAHVETIQITMCLQAFQLKNIKDPIVFQRKLFKFPVRALMLKSYKRHRILMNSAKSSDFILPRGAPAILLSCAQGTNPLQKIPRGPHARTAARA